MDEALALSRQLSHPFTLAHALFYASRLHFACGEVQLAQEEVEEVLEISTDQGFALWVAQGTIWRGYLLAAQGQGEEGMAQIRQGLAAYRPTGSGYGLPIYLASLATAHAVVGQVEEGLTVLAEGLTIVNQTEERWYEAELYRLKGELTLQSSGQRLESGIQKEAEACFQKSLEVARRQRAKSFELRTVISLSHLWRKQGKKEDARQLLYEVYHWFTEGFDTADLEDAKALLDELS